VTQRTEYWHSSSKPKTGTLAWLIMAGSRIHNLKFVDI